MFYFGETDMNIYDTARLMKTPGVDAHVFIDPGKIPTRTKRSVQRMVRDGVYQGTYYSKAKDLAVLVRNSGPAMPYLVVSGTLRPGKTATYYPPSITMYNYELPTAVAHEVVELVRADFAIRNITYPELQAERYGGLGEQREFLERWDAHTKAGFSFLKFFCDDYAMQAVALITATRTPAQIEQANALAARLDSIEHIQNIHIRN
jgi:hypothetical protein